MTEKLFYKDSHLSKFDAEVLSCVRAKRQQVKDSFGRLDGKAGEYYEIELDRTAFFPEGGGQYADTGVLYMADDDTCGLDETARKKVQVLDVRERKYRLGRTLYEDAAAYGRAYRFRADPRRIRV